MTVDGAKTPLLPGAFIAFNVGEGKHLAKIVYRPAAFYWSLRAREMAKSDLVVIWGTNPVNTQINVMTHAVRSRKERGAKIIAVDVYMNGTMEAADLPVTPVHTLETILDDPHLVATGFFEPEDHPTEGPYYACHRDGDRHHNTPGNLYWGSASQNVRDAQTHGTYRPPVRRRDRATGDLFAAPTREVAYA